MAPPLDARQLRAFVTLAQTGSFTEAARRLHLTQSAISHSLRALEEEVRCGLFDRVGKTVSLTQAGEQLLLHAHRILAEMETARQRLEELSQWGQGRLRLGASPTACQYILPPVLREFKASFPRCRIQIEPGDTPVAIELLCNNRVDLALGLEPNRNVPLEFHPLFSDELQFVLSPLHPWAQAGRVERADIPRQHFILYTRASYMFSMIEEYFRQEDLALATTIELGNIEAIKELIKLGLGISILAPWVAAKELAEGSLRTLPLGPRKLKRRWGVLLRPSQPLNLPQEAFLSLCKAAVAAGPAEIDENLKPEEGKPKQRPEPSSPLRVVSQPLSG